MPATLAPDCRRASVRAVRPVAPPAARFTVNGSDVLEQHLTHVCNKLLVGIGDIIPGQKLVGLVLGGGYGRGEGGVLKTAGGDRLYNDLEFYVLVRRRPWWNARRDAGALHELGDKLAVDAGVEVEFKIISPAQLRRSPPSLFYHDLVMGHRWLSGDDRLFAGCEHHRVAGCLPLSEATRLLMNRCSGLLFASEKLEHADFLHRDADFVCRNIAKTELALGDAVLIAFGDYHWSCRERGRRLGDLVAADALPWIEEVRDRHLAGIEFKLEPHRTSLSRDRLREQLCAVRSLALRVWLWLENRRLGGDFRSADGYVSSDINKWPDTSRWRNRLANLKVFGPRALLLAPSCRHPRERILNALILLLWGGNGTSHEVRQQVRRELWCPEPSAIMAAYHQRWSRAS